MKNLSPFPGLASLCTALFGVALGFLSIYVHSRPLGIGAFLIAGAGVIGAVAAVIRAWWRILFGGEGRVT